MGEDPPGVVTENFAVCQCAVGRRPHRAEIAAADLRVDRGTGKLAVRKHDAALAGGHHHFLEKLGANLMPKTAGATVDCDNDAVFREPEYPANGGIEDLGDGLNFQVV